MMDYNNTDSILLILISLENADSKVFTIKNINNTNAQIQIKQYYTVSEIFDYGLNGPP